MPVRRDDIFDRRAVLQGIGRELKRQVQDNILSGLDAYDSPLLPLAPSTIKRKKSNKPLIDTGALLGSVTYYATESNITVGINQTAPYGRLHNEGLGVPKRQFIPLEGLPSSWERIIADRLDAGFRFDTGTRQVIIG